MKIFLKRLLIFSALMLVLFILSAFLVYDIEDSLWLDINLIIMGVSWILLLTLSTMYLMSLAIGELLNMIADFSDTAKKKISKIEIPKVEIPKVEIPKVKPIKIEHKSFKDSYELYFIHKVMYRYLDIENKETREEFWIFMIYTGLTIAMGSLIVTTVLTLFTQYGAMRVNSGLEILIPSFLFLPSITMIIRRIRTIFT